MTRLQRALWIRDHILQQPRHHWTAGSLGGEGRTLRRPSYVAYHMAYDALGNRADIGQLPGVATDPKSPFYNRLDIYVSSFENKAFGLSWSQDQLPHLRSMKRGAWESELFGLPPYVAPSKAARYFYTPKIVADLVGNILHANEK